jgi:hypothetical protein
MTGLSLGLLFFPSIDFSKSLLIGVIFDKSNFNEIFTNSLLFWSFFFATFSPVFFDIIYRRVKKLQKSNKINVIDMSKII